MTLSTGIRVLVVGRYPRSTDAVHGGVEAVTAALCPALTATDGVEQVVVLAFEWGRASMAVEEISPRLRVIRAPRQRRFELPTRAMGNARVLRSIANQYQIDVIHAQGIGMEGDVALQGGRPTVATVHGIPEVEERLWHGDSLPSRMRLWLLRQQVRRVLGRSTAIISISKYDHERYHDFIRGRSYLIPNPVAPLFFARSGDAYDGTSLVYGGWIQRRKNVDGLIRAYARLRERGMSPALLLAGPTTESGYEGEIRRLIADTKLDDDVRLLGHQNWPALAELMRGCAAVTLFSHQETLPTILAQAMALGRPVIGSDVGGVRELIQDGVNGYVVAPGDEEGLADRWEAVLASESLRRRLGSAGREIALDRFSAEAIARKTAEVYCQALSQPGRAGDRSTCRRPAAAIPRDERGRDALREGDPS